MLEISKYKKEYDKVVEGLGINPEQIYIFCESDMNRDMSAGNTFIAVTEKELLGRRGAIFACRRAQAAFKGRFD